MTREKWNVINTLKKHASHPKALRLNLSCSLFKTRPICGLFRSLTVRCFVFFFLFASLWWELCVYVNIAFVFLFLLLIFITTAVVITVTSYFPCAREKIVEENLICCLPQTNVKCLAEEFELVIEMYNACLLCFICAVMVSFASR